MYRSFVSWRYLFARRTNLIGIVGIFVGVSALILILSIMTGFLEQSRSAVRGSLADILIEPYQVNWAGKELPSGPRALLSAVRADERVVAASAQLHWGGIITRRGFGAQRFQQIASSATDNELLAIKLVGVDVGTAERVSVAVLRGVLAVRGVRLPPIPMQDELDTTELLTALSREPRTGARVRNPFLPFLPPPDYKPLGRPKAGVVVGEQLFYHLGLARGDEIQISTAVLDPATNDWRANNREFVVSGTFRSGENEVDIGRIFLERSELADFMGGAREYSHVLLRLRDYHGEHEAVQADLRNTLAEAGLIQGGDYGRYEVRTWEELRRNLLGAIENERVLMAIMLSLVLVVAGFTVFAILSMMVTEKRRDIGVLCAVGATPGGIMQLFLMIAFWDALIGTTFGAIAGWWAALRIDPIEQWLSSKLGIQIFNRDVYLFDHIPSIVDPLAVVLIVTGAFSCALLFAAVPAWHASRMDPLEALRYE